MKNVDLYGRVRHAVLIDGMSSREAARVFGCYSSVNNEIPQTGVFSGRF